MTGPELSVWSRPITFLVVTVWAIVFVAFFERWASMTDGRPFSPAGVAGALIFLYGVAVIAALLSALIALVSKKPARFLADFNLSFAVVLAMVSVAFLDLTFHIF
jgi:hypothetical protein